METLFIKTKPPVPYPIIMSYIGVSLVIFMSAYWLLPSAYLYVVSALLLLFFVFMVSMLSLRRQYQPHVSFSLTFMHLQFHHLRGGWITRWSNVQHVEHATLRHQDWHQSIPWVGIQLKSYGPFLETICPRLINHLLQEQRALIVMAHRRIDNPEQPLEDILFDDTPYKAANGKLYKGLLAMLANQMHHNRTYLGVDILVNEEHFSGTVDEFVGLCRRFLAAQDHEEQDINPH